VITVANHTTIQIIQSWDESEIANLYRAGGWWKEEYEQTELRHLMRGSFLFAVAVDEKTGRAIGMGRVISDGVSDGYIQDLVVLPEYRKTGIGSQIVSTLVKKCVEQGISWIGLIAEPATEKFYLPIGFHPMEGHTPLLFRRGT
jgi:aralkylamine N-acetyltransferase